MASEVTKFSNNPVKFQESVMKIKPEHEQNLKISLGGWWAWKNWFFVKVTFWAPVIFWSLRSWKNDQKLTGAKKVKMLKNQLLHACQLFGIYFKMKRHFFSKWIWFKSLFIVGTLVGLMWSVIKKSWTTSSCYYVHTYI